MRENKIKKRAVWFITLVMFVALYLFDNGSWGNYVFGGCAALVFLVGVVLGRKTTSIVVRPFYIFILCFSIYCLSSYLWAWEPSAALDQAKRMFLILLCFAMVYLYYEKQDNIDALLDCIMWGGYVVSIYAIFAFGGVESVFSMLIAGHRPNAEETFINVNVLGMLGAVAGIIQIYKMVNEKKFLSSVLLIPTIIIIALTQSKKAILMLIIGAVLIAVSRGVTAGKGFKILKVAIALLIVFVVGYYVINLEIFSGLRDRFNDMFSTMSGEDQTEGTSTWERMKFIEIGMAQFWDTPILGVGIGSSKALLLQKYGEYTYLHNNYVELLACGGIVGFAIHYSMYVYLLYNLIKYRRYDVQRADFCIILIIVLLVTDYGFVSYNVKSQYFYLATFFIQVDLLKRAANRKEALTTLTL